MQTVTINIINPKALKFLNELVDLQLISFDTENKYSDEFLNELDKEYDEYQNGIGKNYSKEEVFDLIRQKKVV